MKSRLTQDLTMILNMYRSTKKKVKNIDLWRRLDEAIQFHDIQWHWVKGHSGDPGNEAADALAHQGMDAYGRDTT